MLLVEFALRISMFFLGVANVFWSVKGARRMARGSFTPPSIYLAQVFFSNLTFASFQVRWYVETKNPAWAIMLVTFSLIAGGLAMLGHFAGSAKKATDFYSLYDALPQAVAIAALTRFNRAAGEAMAAECYARIIAGEAIHVQR